MAVTLQTLGLRVINKAF